MDHCYNSFAIRVQGAQTVASGNPLTSIRTWGTVGQYYFSLDFTPGGGSIYNIEGFKNVNIYGFGVVGIVNGYANSANKCAVVSDWAINLSINGNPPLISGQTSVTQDGYGIATSGAPVTRYNLSKYTNLMMLGDPITSVKSIGFNSFFAQGIGAEFLNQVELYFDLNYTFYYKYEGEDD